MSVAIAQQLALVFMGRNLDSQWASSTANLLNGGQPSVALQTAFYNAAVSEGVFHTNDSPSVLVNEIFLNIFGFSASSFEQTAWGNLITNGTLTKETAAWTIFKSYLGATNVPDAYKLPAQSKLVAMNSYSEQLLKDGAANLALASGGTAATSARAYVSGVTSQTSAATAISTVEATVHALTVVVGQTFTLTAGIDTITGTSGNDTFTGSGQDSGLSQLDTIDGGDGTDTLSVTAINPIVINNVSVRNIESAVLTSALDVSVNTTAWTGLKTLTVNSAAGQFEEITAATTTAVKITNASAQTVTLNGSGGAAVVNNDFGGNINIGQFPIANAITSASTYGGSVVAIQDRSGTAAATGSTLTKVIVDGNFGAATLTGDGITAVTIADTNQNATIVAAAGTRSLALTVNTVTGGIITDATATGVTVTSTGAANTVADLAFAAAKAVTISGDKALTVTTTHLGAATGLTVNGSGLVKIDGYNTTNKLTGVTISGSGGFSSDLSGQGAQLVKIDASASTGPNTVKINTTESYLGGSGVDTVIAAAAPTVTVDGGAGANDVFVVDAASFSLSKVVNFETLGAGSSATGAYSAAGFSHLTEGLVAGAITWNSVAAGTDLTYTGSPTAATTYTLATDTAADVLSITLKSAGVLSANTLNATTVETINISLVDTDTTKHVDTITIADTALKSLVITGNAGLTLTNTDTTVTSADASAVTNTAGTAATGFSWTTGALASAVVIKGTSTGGDVINAAAATKAVTITEYAGTNTITGSSTIASTLTGGSGVDTIVGGAGKDTIVGGGGADVITGKGGADSITISGATSKIVNVALGDSGTNTSMTVQTSDLTSTYDIIRGVVAGTTFQLATNTPSVNLTAGNLAGTDDYINFARGTYDAAGGVFTYAANGADTAMTYDTTVGGGTAYEAVILVGYVAGSTTAVSGGLITFA